MSIQGIQSGAMYPAQIQKAAQAAPVEGAQTPAAQPREQTPRYDEYVPENSADRQPIGLYRITHDGDGTPRVRFDDPEKAPKAESCTTNTDKVDDEIERLKKEREQLEQQLRSSADPGKAQELEKRLAGVENELRQKDNDAYRRQHASVT